MNWDDTGFLLSKNRYNENSLIAEFFTENHGKCSGLIFGATSKKIKNYLQLGNKLNLNYNYKIDNRLGYFNTEIVTPEEVIFSDNTTMVTLPSYEGDMGVLKNHIPIITFLRPGIIKVEKSEKNTENFFIQDGTVEYFNNNLTILSSSNFCLISSSFLRRFFISAIILFRAISIM